MKSVSLCSYSYNDGELLHGLLSSLAAWPRLPDEIVLVDDGSDKPFKLTPAERKLPVCLIRLPENRGFTTAKHTALSAATGDIIIGMDCDGRLEGPYLDNAERLLARPEAGLVSIADSRQAEGDLLSSYLHRFEVEPRPKDAAEAEFLAGGSFALRRETWREIGGLSGYKRDLAEDFYLSLELRKRGYKLLLERECKLRFVRRISRRTFCRRLWKCYEESWLAALRPEKALTDVFELPLTVARRHCAEIIAGHPPVWLYFELLSLCHVGLMFCGRLGPEGIIPPGSGVALLGVLQSGPGKYPALYRLLKADLMRGGALPLAEPREPGPADRSRRALHCDWQSFAAFLGELDKNRLLEYLEKIGVEEILDDEAALQSDFSSY